MLYPDHQQFDLELGLRAPTELLGRDDDLAVLSEILPRSRLVTISGPPGVGKTRFAVELLVRISPPFIGGAFCDLAGIVEGDAMLHAVARALDAPIASTPSRADSTRLLGASLATRGRFLLVFDNVDEAVEAARALVPELLVLAPAVTIVVTSRARLSLAIERMHVLAPLATEQADAGLPAAARLFLERARNVSSDRWDDPASLLDVLAIVRALDGLPLAIELAAARTSLLTPREILQRLGEPMGLLEDGGRSLKSAIDASWRLLSPDQRLALAACSAIQGPFGIDLVEQACARLGLATPVVVLQSLRERSLLQLVGPQGARRLRVYESVRAFVHGAFDGGEQDRALFAVASAGRAAAERWIANGWGPDGPEALRMLLREEKAFEGLVGTLVDKSPQDPELVAAAIEMGSALIHLREELGPTATLATLVRRLLDLLSRADTAIQARPQAEFEARAAGVLLRVGDIDRARSLCQTAIERAREAREPRIEGLGLLVRAAAARVLNQDEELHASLERALALSKRHDDPVVGALAEQLHADWYQAHLDVDRALAAAERALTLAEASGDPRLACRAELTRAMLLADLGESVAAYELALRIRTTCEQIDDRKGLGFAYVVAGACALELERRTEADELFERAVAHGKRIGMPRLVAYALAFRAVSRVEQRDFVGGEEALAEADELLGPTAERQRVAAVRIARGALVAILGRIDEGRRMLARLRTSGTDGAPATDLRDEILGLMLSYGVAVGEADRDLERGDRAAAEQRLGEVVRSLDRTKRELAARYPMGRPPSAVLRLTIRMTEQFVASYAPPADALVVYEQAQEIRRPDGRRVAFANNPLMWRLCAALADGHARQPGTPIARDDLVRRLWPGERILESAAKNRLAVTLHKLRRAGFEDLLTTSSGGASLRPELRVVWAARHVSPPARSTKPRRKARR